MIATLSKLFFRFKYFLCWYKRQKEIPISCGSIMVLKTMVMSEIYQIQPESTHKIHLKRQEDRV